MKRPHWLMWLRQQPDVGRAQLFCRIGVVDLHVLADANLADVMVARLDEKAHGLVRSDVGHRDSRNRNEAHLTGERRRGRVRIGKCRRLEKMR